jgi:hypothetical protein
MSSRHGWSPVGVVDEDLLELLASRLSEIGGDATTAHFLHDLAIDVLGPFDESDLTAAQYQWLLAAIVAAARAAGDKATRALVEELAERLADAPHTLSAGLDRARIRHLVEIS